MRSLIILVISTILYNSPLSANCIKGNCKIGLGTFEFQDGSRYSGQFNKGVPHGKGRLIMVKGDVYEGEFYFGKKQGEGKYHFSSGNKYIGQFKGDKISGKGKMEYADNTQYQGNWKNNKPHGYGTYFYSNGRKVTGFWKSGRLVKKAGAGSKILDPVISTTAAGYKNCNNSYCHNEIGKYTYGDGSYYIGQFINGAPEGEGTCHYVNGDVYQGGCETGRVGDFFAPDETGGEAFSRGSGIHRHRIEDGA